MKLQMKKGLVGLALVAVATAAWAIVTFDPNSGYGFVGKGDVCTALSIPNCKNPPLVTFNYSDRVQYTQDCVNVINERKTITKTSQRMRNVNSMVAASIRNQGGGASKSSSQNEGYTLSGFGATTSAPVPTDLCVADPEQSGWTAAGPLVATSLGGQLTVSNGGGGVVIGTY